MTPEVRQYVVAHWTHKAVQDALGDFGLDEFKDTFEGKRDLRHICNVLRQSRMISSSDSSR